MKTQEEIEQLANDKYQKRAEAINDSTIKGIVVSAVKGGFVDGYMQCQKDIKPLLKDLWDLWERLAEVGELHIGTNFTKKYEELKNSINKQD